MPGLRNTKIEYTLNLKFFVLDYGSTAVFQAAEYKAQYAMSYADCFALACAIENSAVLITGDPEFQAVSHLVKIEWIR
jgi:ribonuclease VapC